MFPRTEGKPSKTHEFDDSVIANTTGRLFLGSLVERQAKDRTGRSLRARLWHPI